MEPAALITALTTLVIGLIGARQWALGRRDNLEKDRAAAAVAAQDANFTRLESIVDHLQEEIDRAWAARDVARGEHQSEKTLWLAERVRLDGEVRRLTSDVLALAGIVRDEVAREAARTAYEIEAAE